MIIKHDDYEIQVDFDTPDSQILWCWDDFPEEWDATPYKTRDIQPPIVMSCILAIESWLERPGSSLD